MNKTELVAAIAEKAGISKKDADKALAAARAIFSSGELSENMPTTALSDSDFTDGRITVVDLMLKSGLAPSKGEARRLIQQGGVTIRSEKVSSSDFSLALEDFSEDVILKKGKKTYHRFILSE